MTNGNLNVRYNPLPTAQALLLLMVMAAWACSDAIFKEAAELQSILANFIREERLLELQHVNDRTWHEWIQTEGLKRTTCPTDITFVEDEARLVSYILDMVAEDDPEALSMGTLKKSPNMLIFVQELYEFWRICYLVKLFADILEA
ncbi:uncharacterized protein BDW43DRAFT_312071 [Aspergillus alliaceus]|uniref:uncharacterized protein n=1 Tax=Petromyces alliaceus TaxID=209559 RepID=UPI0012A6EA60|nr:uncharacterized protein BDW43DRAFT_312071 [Aspergillus alliaceus]KAB8232388.1 hypothetical protein BDW43DRAFT_312071 [Aspergillus alliaceus]